MLDDDWSAVVRNLRKARKRWESMSRIIGLEGADPHTSGNFYKALVEATLIFGAESWVMPPWIRRTLGCFHYRVFQHMAKKTDRGGNWIYLSLDKTM